MPLKVIVEHKAHIAYLRKVDRLKDNDGAYCIATNVESLEDEVRYLFPSDYDQENEDAENFLHRKYKDNKGKIDSTKIYRDIAHKIFGHHNGRIKLKESQLEHYNLYTTSLDTYVFFATYLMELSKELVDEHQRLNYLMAHLDESFSFDGNLEEKFTKISDIHIHLGAALDFHYRIHEVLKNPNDYNEIENHFEPQEHTLDKPAKVFQRRMYILMSLYESAIIEYYLQADSSNEDRLYAVWDTMQLLFDEKSSSLEIENTLSSRMTEFTSPRATTFDRQNLEYEHDIVNKGLLHGALDYFNEDDKQGYEPKKGDKALLVYMTQKLFSEDNNTLIYRMIEGYFIMRNIFKSVIYQQHRRSGFGYFTSYSRNSMKKATNNNLKHIFNSILHPEIATNAEIRIGPPKDASTLHNWFITLHRTVHELKKELETSEIEYNIKTIFHLLKKKSKPQERVRYAANRETYKHNTYVLNQFLTDRSTRYYKDDRKRIIDLAYRYFHGIDAASNELNVPPEVFAPVYSFFKNSVISSGFAIATDECVELPKRIDLQYTYHVGEEYRDIVSGVRAIFEAIIFLNLKDEDRLGHAVALGIDPALFLNSRKHITLTKGEYMDNLIFIYYIFNTCDTPLCSLEEIRSNIEQLGNDIYGDVSNEIGRSFTIDDYIAGWLLRRNCPLQIDTVIKNIGYETIQSSGSKIYETAWKFKQFIKENETFLDTYVNDGFERAYLKASLPDFFNHTTEENEPIKRYLSIRNSQKAYVLYWAYATMDEKSEYNKFYDGNVTFPLDVYEYLQDYVMENYVAKRDVVIEILPTSNLLITPIGKYENHPFLRLNPPLEIVPNKFNIRTKKIKIALGTDDPGIHGTSLMMEYHILNDIIAKKYDKRIAEKYLKTLAEFGNYLFEKGRKG
jgi:adenosine deaminase